MRYLIPVMFLLFSCSSSKGSHDPKTAVLEFFHCMDQHDVACLWDMSGPKTQRVFSELSNRLNKARQRINKKVPPAFRQRYIKALMLDKLSNTTSPKELLTRLLDVKNLRAPTISKDDMVIQSLKGKYTAYLPGNITLLLTPGKDGLKLEVLGNTLTDLPIYHTLLNNLKILDKDIALFDKAKKQPKKT